MSVQLTSTFKRHSFFWSFILHLLFLILYLFFQFYHPHSNVNVIDVPRERPALDLSAYLYHPPQLSPQPSHQRVQQRSQQQVEEVDPLGLKKSTAMRSDAMSQPVSQQASPASEAIHLVGDKKKPPKPLVKLIGIALTRHLIYPKIAIDFNVKGTAMVGFTIHPDGQVTDVKLVKSSSAKILDDAALTAVRDMSPVPGVHGYVSAPKFLVIGILFR